MRKVSSVAAKLEAHPGYKSDSHTKTWYAKGALGMTHPTAKRGSSSRDQRQAQDNKPPATVDIDSNIQMSGVNQLAALLVNAIGKVQKKKRRETHSNQTTSTNSVAGSDKLYTKWITSEEMVELARAGKCFCCRKKGHRGNQCLDFCPAKRPGGQVNSTGTKAKEPSDLEEDFELCSLDSDSKLGKE